MVAPLESNIGSGRPFSKRLKRRPVVRALFDAAANVRHVFYGTRQTTRPLGWLPRTPSAASTIWSSRNWKSTRWPRTTSNAGRNRKVGRNKRRVWSDHHVFVRSPRSSGGRGWGCRQGRATRGSRFMPESRGVEGDDTPLAACRAKTVNRATPACRPRTIQRRRIGRFHGLSVLERRRRSRYNHGWQARHPTPEPNRLRGPS